MPEELSEAELKKEVSKAIAHLNAESMKDMGTVMKYLKEKLGNNVDGKSLSANVRRELQSWSIINKVQIICGEIAISPFFSKKMFKPIKDEKWIL